ncbi:MAG: hypothetical protein HZA93_23645 [Verrucomicrobia bacterium]|nr:hypothetical protein [Verrucomicrobiota bacterium]
MNAAKQRKYWWLFGPVRDVLRSRGFTDKQIEERRHLLHRKALGADKSSKDFTDDDLDKVKAAFRAEWDGGNLNAQLDALDEPAERRQALLDACAEAVADMFALGDGRLEHDKARRGYIAGAARNVIKKELADCDETELGEVKGCLQRRVRVLRARNPEAAERLDERKKEAVPF